MAPVLHKVRFKGVTLGSFTSVEIAERLRSGELSLSHVVEHRGRWLTLRLFLRETSQIVTPTTGGGALGRQSLKQPPIPPGDTPPPPPGADTVAESIESRVREGYLWCGLTFVLPLVLGFPVWALGKFLTEGPDPALRPLQITIALTLSAIAASGYAGWRAYRNSMALDAEGLDDVGQSMRQLALGLCLASSGFWVLVVWLWLAR